MGGCMNTGQMQDISADELITSAHAYEWRNILFNEIKTRDDVLDLEAFIKTLGTSFDECPYPLFHSFADGMYTREIHFNKGDLIVGKIHKKEYFVNVLKGRIWVVSEFGAKEIIAPASFKARAGVKHIGFTLEDTVWSDTHKVASDNVEDAEKEIFVDSYEELDAFNRVVYSEMCKDLGRTEDEIRLMSESGDLIEQPKEDAVEIKNSDVEGFGVFTTKDMKNGDMILARKGGLRTPAGRYVNHSDDPNSEGVIENDMGFFLITKDIELGEEITADYRNIRNKADLLDRSLS